MKNQILVTGAAGFIASHLIEFLLDMNYRVIGIDNFDPFYDKKLKEQNLAILKKRGENNFVFYNMDIRDRKSLLSLEESFETVIHIAAKAGVRPSIESPNEYISTNIDGTQNVLDLMNKKSCKKLIFASSSSVYGNNEKVPFSEQDEVNHPISPYAFTKKANELQIHTYHNLYNINAICLRFFTVYGPRQRPDLAIRKFATLIRSNQPIDMYGDGSTGRDYTYVSDIVGGIFSAKQYLEDNPSVYEVINLGNSSPVLLHEMIDTLYEVMGGEKNINQCPMQPGDVERTFADISKAEKLLDYRPKVSFKEGVERLRDWMDVQNI